jgi:hypothetical protein
MLKLETMLYIRKYDYIYYFINRNYFTRIALSGINCGMSKNFELMY